MTELREAIIRLAKEIENTIEMFNDFYMSLPKYMRTEIMFPKKKPRGTMRRMRRERKNGCDSE